jgi:pyruvate formate lyase activating enzyme
VPASVTAGAIAKYWRGEEGGIVRCELCPHRCALPEGKSGLCKTRRNEGGRLDLPYYGLVSSLAIDPIEKKPLHHFLPGSSIFSAGFVGCNMHCPFCQNWHISQEAPAELESIGPETLVEAALRSGTPSIAYTYSEPSIHFEYLIAAMTSARSAGLKNVLVTNGCINPAPARELLSLTDAVNVDLKAWSQAVYSKTLGGDRDTVLEFLRIAASLCHVEATTLVVSGVSDDRRDIAAVADFLASLSPELPLHLSAYHPAWKESSPPTSPGLLAELAGIAREKLRYVYIGNVAELGADTMCPGCGERVIARRGYRIDTRGLKKMGGRGYCAGCGIAMPIIV